MRLPARLLCTLLACMCALCGLSAQTPEGTTGRVVDENGEAVAGAYLIAVDPGTSEVLAATATDAEGEYTLPVLPEGFTLNVSCIGYESLDIPVEGGSAGLEAVGTIRMQSVATRIDEAVVTADAPKIERELGRFVMRDVSASPLAKGSSTYNFLKFMPMVNVRPEGGVTVLNKTANIRINGLRSADGYESDPGRTNRFVYDDLNLAGYASYSRVWSGKFESEVGARVELYRARGTQLTDYGTVDRDDFGVYPTLSLLYMPSDAHELSLDLSTSITRPTYTMLNPFITYTSPTTCTQFNPDLKAGRDLDLMFCYVLLDDYMLTVDYWYCSNIWTEFTLPDGDMTRRFTANYGNSHDLYASLLVSKSLFKGCWNLSAEAEVDYMYDFGGIEGRPIDNHDLSWGITLKNNVALSRRHNWYLDVKYQYSSASSYAAVDLPVVQEIEAYLMKEFDRASLSIGVYGTLMPELIRSKTYGDYAFTINDRRYITGVVTFSYTFGNKRARRVAAHSNQDIVNRIQ